MQALVSILVLVSLNAPLVTSLSSPRLNPQNNNVLSSSMPVTSSTARLSKLWSSATLEPVLLEKAPAMVDHGDVSVVIKRETRTAPSTTTATTTTHNNISKTTKKGGISMTVDELAVALGGRDRAQLVWDCYSIGVDPTKLYGNMVDLGYDDFESINESLPKTSRCCRLFSDSLGPQVLQSLSKLYSSSEGGKVENGVATLFKSVVSLDADGSSTTKIVLTLSDGMKVECTITSNSSSSSSSTLNINSEVIASSSQSYSSQRGLSSDEILSQMFFARKVCRWENLPDISSVVVFMGKGRPSNDHTEAVTTATNILRLPETFSLRDKSKVTLSMGVVPTKNIKSFKP